MNLFFAAIITLSSSKSIQNDDCDKFIFKMATSTKEYKLKRKEAQRMGKCIKEGWFMFGSPIIDSNSNISTKLSSSYDFGPFCAYAEDEFYFFENFSFDPQTKDLYLSENIGQISAGEHKIKFIKKLKYKKKWLRKFLKCKRKSNVSELE